MNPKRSLSRWAPAPPAGWRPFDGGDRSPLPPWLRPALGASLVLVGLLGLAGVLQAAGR